MSDGVEISTDGGCIGNPGPGGWAFVIRAGEETVEGSGFEAATTNNRMELTAVIESLKVLQARPGWASLTATVTTDSQYVQKGITEWIFTWVKNGWKTSTKKPVKNADLWTALWEITRRRPVKWQWVMGHSGNVWNERCHTLVEAAVKRGA
jgi:ribonuclease HI